MRNVAGVAAARGVLLRTALRRNAGTARPCAHSACCARRARGALNGDGSSGARRRRGRVCADLAPRRAAAAAEAVEARDAFTTDRGGHKCAARRRAGGGAARRAEERVARVKTGVLLLAARGVYVRGNRRALSDALFVALPRRLRDASAALVAHRRASPPVRCRSSPILRRRRGRRRASASRRRRQGARPADVLFPRYYFDEGRGKWSPRIEGGHPPRAAVFRVEREGGGRRRIRGASTDTTRIDLAALSAKRPPPPRDVGDRLLDAGIMPSTSSRRRRAARLPRQPRVPAVAPFVSMREQVTGYRYLVNAEGAG